MHTWFDAQLDQKILGRYLVHSYQMFVRKYASGSSNRMVENDERMLESMLYAFGVESISIPEKCKKKFKTNHTSKTKWLKTRNHTFSKSFIGQKETDLFPQF